MSTIFLYSVTLFTSPFEGYISYFVYLVFLPAFLTKYGIPKTPLILFFPLLVSGIIYIQIGSNTWALFIKVFLGFFLSVLFFAYVMRVYGFNVKSIFKMYMIASLVVSVIGLVQIFSYFIGFEFGYNLAHYGLNKWSYIQGGIGIRLNSIFSEPSYFAAVIAPAFFVSLQNLIRKKFLFVNKFGSIAICVAYLLTFSSVGIFGIFLTIVLLLLNFGLVRYAIVFVPLFYFSFDYAYNNVEEFRARFDGTIDVFSSPENIKTYEVHGSSFVLYNNYHIALENWKRNPFFGTGLGSHPIAFDKYSLTKIENAMQIEFNKADANSMFLRLLSETGLYGVGIMLFFLIKSYVFKGRSADDEYWIISNALALIIVLYLLRQGHYFINGFPFFLWMYYYVWKKNKIALDEQASDDPEDKVEEEEEVNPFDNPLVRGKQVRA